MAHRVGCANDLGAPVQELPNAHKLVRLYCLPLRGRHAQWSCPTNVERTLAVGRAPAIPAEGYAASVALLRRERLRSRVVVPYDLPTKLLYKVLDLTV